MASRLARKRSQGELVNTITDQNSEPELVQDEKKNGKGVLSMSDGSSPRSSLSGGGSHGKLVPPELVQKMTAQERLDKEKTLRKKIDARLMPMIVLIYVMNYLDRNNIASARLAGPEGKGVQDELKLTSNQYQTSISILFVGYILMQVPSNMLLNKIGYPAIYLPSCMIVWGIISTCTGAITNFAGLLITRFMLGFVEAAFFPGALFFLSSWYTRKELALRTAFLYSGSLISGAFSGFLTAGITSGLDGVRGLRAWRWLFIIEGAATVVIAFSAYFVLPNFPRTTSWLTEEEKQLAVWRLQEDVGEDDWKGSADQSFGSGLKMAVKDIKTYILALMLLSLLTAGSVTNFFPTIVQTLNFSTVETLLLTTPPYILAFITTLTNAWHADRTGERFYHITIPLAVATFAFILAASTSTIAPRYFAIVLIPPGVYTGYVVALAWISSTFPRPPAKRAVALAFINAFSSSASIYSSFLYPQSDEPLYSSAMGVNAATCVISIICAIILRSILVKLNKRLDAGEYVEGAIQSTGKSGEKAFRFLV